jgi:2-polyprenyl-3-methyl-5-hydroxy-6-metoxy-1,4-benzoquinol methylase
MDQGYPQHTHCLVSNSNNLEVLKGYERHYLVKSKPLGFVFCSRIPTEIELQNHYGQYNREEYYSPITRLRYAELLDEFEPYRETNKILDIGCGTGFFLEVAKEKGWEVYGTEFTDSAVTICKSKGINMQQGRLNGTRYSEGMFDVITSFEVIEHINNPVEEVKYINRILRKGGIFYVTTPNFNALERFLLKDKYSVIEYPEHLSYYTSKTLNYLFTHNGFVKKKIKTTGISISRIRTGFRTMANKPNDELFMSASSKDELLRGKSQTNIVFKTAKVFINVGLNLFKIGNSLKGWFVKQ